VSGLGDWRLLAVFVVGLSGAILAGNRAQLGEAAREAAEQAA